MASTLSSSTTAFIIRTTLLQWSNIKNQNKLKTIAFFSSSSSSSLSHHKSRIPPRLCSLSRYYRLTYHHNNKVFTNLIRKSSSSTSFVGNDVELAKKSLRDADCLCFDVDSTVVLHDGIDVLAAYLGKGKEVSEVTTRAMDGHMKVQDALSLRLSILQPSRRQIERCLTIHPFQLTPHVDTFIKLCKEQYQKDIYFLSGGLRVMIEPIANQLGLSEHHIIANTLLFDADGFYESFDSNEPTSQDMGKAAAIQSLIDIHHYKTVVMIGDGFTDTQAKPPATAFIGYGGVAIRAQVQNLSDWYVTDFQALIDCLQEQQK